jgi:prolyl oligopeptidase
MAIFTTPRIILAFCVFSLANAYAQKDHHDMVYPKTEKEGVKDTYFGKVIADPYRWLEDDRSKRTEDWVVEQNLVTEAYLSWISYRDKIKKRLSKLWNFNKQSAPFKKGDNFFCYKNSGLQNQSVLYMAKSYDAKTEDWQVLLDPNTLSSEGTTALNGISISNDHKTLAYSVSNAGSDWAEIRFKDIATKQDLPDVIKWVKFSGMSWRGNGIYYSRYDEPTGSALSQKNTGHKLFYHKLGDDQSKDELIYKDDNHPNYNFSAQVSHDEKFLIVSTSETTSGEKLMIKDLTIANSSFAELAKDFSADYSIIDNIDHTFYLLTNKGAPKYKLVSFTFKDGKIGPMQNIIPQAKDLLEGVRLCNKQIIANYLKDATSKLFVYGLDGKLNKEIQLPGLCKLSSYNSDKHQDFATYSIIQYIAPEQSYYLDANTWESKLIFKPNIDFKSEDYITEQHFYKSKDGTMVPMFITHKKGLVMTEETPAFVYGYGGFNISLGPEFRIDRAMILEAGGIYCVPNLRGGGEYGEDWHKAGTKCKKQNVFNDFIAACEYLVAKKMTSHKKIAIHGRSNGGLLIGAVMTQRPDICKVALPTVGVLDMLRFHLFTIGRAWTVDYGCSENKAEFECLLKYSPLHNVKPVAYPATLILTGDHDDRVVPAHSFKFAATLQEFNKNDNPSLIRIDVNAGHGAGKPTAKLIQESADMWSFTFYNLGLSY